MSVYLSAAILGFFTIAASVAVMYATWAILAHYVR
jgi:hypothetical protein